MAGKQDTVTKKYLSRNDVFADAVNYAVFNGSSRVKPEHLVERDTAELASYYGENRKFLSKQKFRDVLKNCVLRDAEGVSYVIFGVENQSEIHYAMAVKNMLYDALNYAAQVEEAAEKHRKEAKISGAAEYGSRAEFLSGFHKNDRLTPVVTITVLWSPDKWDAPRTLKEMYQPTSEEVLAWLPDYKLNLIIPEELDKGRKFETELGAVLSVIAASNDAEKMKKVVETEKERLTHLGQDSADVLQTFTSLKMPKGEGGTVDMCKAIQDMMEESRQEGRAQERKNTERERQRADDEKRRADDEKRRADDEKRRADDEKQRANDEKRRADTVEQQLSSERKRAEEEIRRLKEELERLKAIMK